MSDSIDKSTAPDIGLALRIIDLMNDLHQRDPSAIDTLMRFRVMANDALGDHPTVQVAAESNGCSLSILGILNGLCGVDARGYGPVTMCVNGNDAHWTVRRFELTEVG